MSRFLHSCLVLLLAFACGQPGLAQSVPAPPSSPASLTLRQAVDRALHLNPEVADAAAERSVATANYRLTRTALLPHLQFTEEITRGDDPVYAFGMRLRQRQFTQANFALNELNRPLPLANFATRFAGQWMLFDSMRTEHTLRAARFDAQRTASASTAVDQKVVLGVVSAYQGVLYAERVCVLADQQLQTALALEHSADEHVKAGLAVESDRLAAAVHVAARRQEQIAARGNLDLAWAQLQLAVGDDALTPVDLRPIEPHTFEVLPFDQQWKQALVSRADLSAWAHGEAAASQLTRAARSSFGPQINAYGNWEEDRGSVTTTGGNNWVAGASVSIDILPFSRRAELDRARAAQARLHAQHQSALQQARFSVLAAHSHLEVAAQSVAVTQAAIAQADETLRIMRNRYAAGLATITDLLRAEDASRQASNQYWQAVHANALAYAENLFATGTLTPEATETLQ